MDENYGWWLAGLTDGEGNFDIKAVREYFICRFVIGMRADDAPLLHEAQRITGLGAVRIQEMTNGAATQARWEVARKDEVVRLAEIFLRFPLRSKKRHDFDIWKQAVDIWAESKRGNRWHGRSPHTAQLGELQVRLRQGRTFSILKSSVATT